MMGSKSYVRGIRAGIVHAQPTMRIVYETPSTALFDADSAMGIIAASRAMEIAIDKAKRVGSGWVAVTHSHHCGMLAHYATMALEHDMIGVAMSNQFPYMVPAGGVERRLGSNPFAVAVPAGGEPPFILDVSSSVVAGGKLGLAKLQGKNIPEGWAIDRAGNPTTDPYILEQGGALLPLGSTPVLGSHKGYGLAVLVDVLAGVLSGIGTSHMLIPDASPDVVEMRASAIELRRKCGLSVPDTAEEVGQFVGVLRIDAFQPTTEFKTMMDHLIRDLRTTQPAVGIERVRVAGEGKYLTEKERSQRGIPLHPKVVEPLVKLGAELGVPFPH
jgi:L-2-hydroxycarboxylate dehydrogenase (NAD+)